MLPLPLIDAVASRAISRLNRAFPEPPIATSSRAVVPSAWMAPLPGSRTVRLGLLISVTEMFPSPAR